VDFERFELAYKSAKINYESAKSNGTTQSTVEGRPRSQQHQS
jgi:hypothetical protein